MNAYTSADATETISFIILFLLFCIITSQLLRRIQPDFSFLSQKLLCKLYLKGLRATSLTLQVFASGLSYTTRISCRVRREAELTVCEP